MIRDAARLNALLETVRRFVRETAIPNEARVSDEDAVPEEIVAEMRRLGFFGWSIPEEHGGAGLTTEELALANIELARCAVAYRARVGTNTGIGAEALVQDGTPEQRANTSRGSRRASSPAASPSPSPRPAPTSSA